MSGRLAFQAGFVLPRQDRLADLEPRPTIVMTWHRDRSLPSYDRSCDLKTADSPQTLALTLEAR